MEKWNTYFLKDIATFSQGIQVDINNQFIKKDKGLIRFIRIIDYSKNNEPPRYISCPKNSYIVNADDIVMIRYGSQTAGKVVRGISGAIANNMFKITLNNDIITNEYAYYYLLQTNVFNNLRGSQSSSTMPAITFELVGRQKILLPNIHIQKKITTILSSLDEKIELNRRINENLEQQAQALFKSWFVDFEPFKDGKFVDSELGMIPEGWKVKKLGELCDSISVTHPCKEGQLIFLNTGDIENGFVLNHKYMNIKDMPGQAKKSIQENDILYSEIRPINRHFAFVNFPAQEYIVSTKLMVLRANDNESSIRLYQYLTSEDVINELQHEAESRSGTFPQIRFENIKSLKILIGSDDVEKKYTKYIGNIYKMIFQYRKEIMRLAQLRDTLLPRLMSGELAITDVDDRSIFQ